MFTGTVESKSHEGGLLVHFDGSSPALNAIMIRSDDGSYIGKVDGVIGNTGHALAHIAHIDRTLDMDALIGVTVSVRPKKPREERSDRRGDDRRQGGRDNRGFRNDRRGDDRRQGGRDNRGFRNDRGGSQHQDYNDWTCPKCNNSNFARRTVCNRCEEPRPAGSGGGDRRDRRQGGRDSRGFQNNRRSDDRGGQRQQRGTFNDNDWTCPKCKNSNFSFRNVCNRCEEPRPGGGGGRGGPRSNDRRQGGGNNYQRSSYGDRRQGGRDNRGFQNNRGGRRDGEDRRQGGGNNYQRSSYGDRRQGGRDNRGFQNNRGGRRDGEDRRQGGRDDRGFQSNRGGRPDGEDRSHSRSTGGSWQRNGRPQRRSSDNDFRRAKGKRSGHAHNRPPRDFRTPRKFERKDE